MEYAFVVIGVIVFVGGLSLFSRRRFRAAEKKKTEEEPPFQVILKKGLSNKKEVKEPLLTLDSERSDYIMILVVFIGIFGGIIYFMGIHWALVFPLIFILFAIEGLFRHLIIYENAICFQTIFSKKIIYFQDIDSIEGEYQMVQHGTSKVPIMILDLKFFNLIKDGKIVKRIDRGDFKGIEDFESVFKEDNPYIDAIYNRTDHDE